MSAQRSKLFRHLRAIYQWFGGTRVLLTATSVTGVVILLRVLGLLQVWELALLDYRFRLRPLEPRDDRVVIVGITEQDLQKVGQWPIPDAVLTRLLTTIQTYQPRAIGLDLYRDLPVEPGHDQLLAAYQTLPHLVGIQKLKDENSPGVPPPPSLAKTDQVGFNNLVFDVDGRIRRGLLYWSVDGQTHQSFALKLALLYLKPNRIKPQAAPGSNYLQLGKAVFPMLQANDGGYINIDARGYQFLADLRGPAGHFRMIPMEDVLAGRVEAEWLRDRVVIIGSTAESLKDYFFTAYSGGLLTTPQPMAGAEVQANLVSQIVSSALEGRPLLQVWPEVGEWLWIAVWAWLGAALSWRLRSPLRSSLALLVSALGLAGVSYWLFLAGWWIPLAAPEIALVAAAIAIIAHLAYQEEELKRSKEFLNTIINAIPDPMFVKDHEFRWVVLNKAFCDFLAQPPEDLIGKNERDILPDGTGQSFYQRDAQVFASAQPQEAEESWVNGAGVERQIATKRSLHRDAAGNRFLVGVMRDITERKQMEDELKRTAAELERSNEELQQSATRLQHQATHDTLTGLPNRQLFHERLNQALAWADDNARQVGLLFLDLDGFKPINDTLGHDVGDLLLKAVAGRLRASLRGSDTVSRLGGDEFTIILPAIPSAADAARVAQKVLDTLNQSFKIDAHTITITTSIGIALYDQDGADADTLTKAADTAMYQAKELGKNRYQFAAAAPITEEAS